MTDDGPRVLILGAGINGAALARELSLNGVAVTLVDTTDLSFGATAYSSRLIHGGLRYLEFGEFDLVRESLAERTRLLRLAPQFVRPLRLSIPVGNRFGGAGMSAVRFLRLNRWLGEGRYRPRGLWMIRAGLRLYDLYARDPELPRHEVSRVGTGAGAPVNRSRYQWLCSYYDAQVVYPERFVVALLRDAETAAAAQGVQFEVLTHHRASLRNGAVEIRPAVGGHVVRSFQPAAMINATGAWVDQTLASLKTPSRRLMGGTKGSHLVTWNRRLHEALGSDGVYAEADDGRPVFVLPFVDGSTLIGTTDERFEGDPADAVASDKEVAYLLKTVNEILPGVKLTDEDVAVHYSGVRPLPYVPEGSTAGITRRHSLVEHADSPAPFYSVVGGKLTTCRSLAEEVAATLLGRLGLTVRTTSRDRPLPGADDYPRDPAKLGRTWQKLASSLGYGVEQVRTVWSLCGTMVEETLGGAAEEDRVSLDGLRLPLAFVRWAVRREWATQLEDLVERRLMLLYQPQLSVEAISQIANILVEEGRLDAADRDEAVQQSIDRLRRHYGKSVVENAAST